MPKNYQCPCGRMEVRFPGGNIMQLKGGFKYGMDPAWYRCADKDCRGRVRIGFTEQLLDSNGEVYHIPGKTGPGGRGGKAATRKPTRKQNKKEADPINWRFVD